MRYFVMGAGHIGATVAYLLRDAGKYVTLIDKFIKESPVDGVDFVNDDISLLKKGSGWQKGYTIISCLPYHQNLEVAKFAIDNEMNYIDLGGRVDVSKQINEYAKNTKGFVFTDLGLAPGWINIIAEHLCDKVEKAEQVTDVRMYVGGLPNCAFNPLKYYTTWSIDGLVNEYVDNCQVLKDGKLITRPGMGDYELFSEDLSREITVLDSPYWRLEAFNTSGGASHSIQSMINRGVKNCSYKTMRYQGHRSIIKTVYDKLGKDALEKIFDPMPEDVQDVVYMYCKVNGENISTDAIKVVRGRYDGFSAMELATAAPVVTVALMMESPPLFADQPKVLTYQDVDEEDFNEILEEILCP